MADMSTSGGGTSAAGRGAYGSMARQGAAGTMHGKHNVHGGASASPGHGRGRGSAAALTSGGSSSAAGCGANRSMAQQGAAETWSQR